MAKNYNIGSKSDMKRFQKDIEKEVKSQAKDAITKRKFDVECPHCKRSVNIPAGKSLCPQCGEEIDLKLNMKF